MALRITEVKRTDYILDMFGIYTHKDFIGVKDYWYEDTEGNIKPISFTMRWWDGEQGATEDYLGYSDKDGSECIIKWVKPTA